MNRRRAAGAYIAAAYVLVALALLVAHLAGITTWGDIFSLGQLLVDALLLPVAIIGFIMAADEFREGHTSPELDLGWEIKPGETARTITLKVPLPQAVPPDQVVHDRGIRPVLINTGEAVAVWYMVSFDVPRVICEHRLLRTAEKSWSRQLGEVDNWRQDILPDTLRVVFLSNGELACYPGFPLPLGILNLAIAAQGQAREFEVPYSVVTNKGRTTKGSLWVTIEWDHAGDPPQ